MACTTAHDLAAERSDLLACEMLCTTCGNMKCAVHFASEKSWYVLPPLRAGANLAEPEVQGVPQVKAVGPAPFQHSALHMH